MIADSVRHLADSESQRVITRPLRASLLCMSWSPDSRSAVMRTSVMTVQHTSFRRRVGALKALESGHGCSLTSDVTG